MQSLARAIAITALAAGLLGAGYLVYLWGWGPFGMRVETPATTPGQPAPPVPEPKVTTGRESGQHVLLLWSAVLAGISILAAVPTWRGWVWPAGVAGLLLSGLTILGIFSIGIYFAPAAVLHLAAFALNLARRQLPA